MNDRRFLPPLILNCHDIKVDKNMELATYNAPIVLFFNIIYLAIKFIELHCILEFLYYYYIIIIVVTTTYIGVFETCIK